MPAVGTISFAASFFYILFTAAVGIVCCFIGANNPQWFSQKKGELIAFGKKALDDATKTAQAKVQAEIIAPALAPVIAQIVKDELAKALAAVGK